VVELTWHTQQMWRMGDGEDPDPGRTPARALAGWAAASTFDTARRLVKR
jgi:hypothetical protein